MDGTEIRHVVEHAPKDDVIGHRIHRRSQEKETGAGDEDGEVVGFKGRDLPHDEAGDEEKATPWERRGDPP